MKIGMVGLGRMGGHMTLRLLEAGHEVHVYDKNPEASDQFASKGAHPAGDLRELVASLGQPAVVWVMVPAGDVTEETLSELAKLMSPGDLVIDGGNSYFEDSVRRAASMRERGVRFLDAGTSGGIWGLQNGYGLMVGGDDDAYALAEPALTSLAPEGGLVHTGPAGSGHFVKMVHNGIEYGLLQAYAEGFELLKGADWPLDLGAIAKAWTKGTVIRSWLLELLADALRDDPGLDRVRGYVDDSGEGRWTVLEAVKRGVPMTVTAHALSQRFLSRQDEGFQAKVIAALRHEFGGHEVKTT